MFEWYGVPEKQRVPLAAAYFNEVVDAWYQGSLRQGMIYTWEEFSEKLCEQFGERSMMDVVEEFNKLRQTSNVESYQKCFEELRSLMIQHNPHLSETYFVSSYLGGLNDKLRPMVKVLRPQSVEQASKNARLQELVVGALMRKQRPQMRGEVVRSSNTARRHLN